MQDVIVDGHLASDVVLPSLAANIFVLRLDPSVLQKRLQARGYKTKKIKENVAAEILDVCLVDAIAKSNISKKFYTRSFKIAQKLFKNFKKNLDVIFEIQEQNPFKKEAREFFHEIITQLKDLPAEEFEKRMSACRHLI